MVMSSVTTQNEIEYPESDGKPMGETDLHRDRMFRLLEIFRQRYRDQQVYIASDLLNANRSPAKTGRGPAKTGAGT